MAHPFELTHEFEVDATPEEVWQAIATGPGIDSWFMGGTRSSRGRRRHADEVPRRNGGLDDHGLAAAHAPRESHAGRSRRRLRVRVHRRGTRQGQHRRPLGPQRLPRRQLGEGVRGPVRRRPDVLRQAPRVPHLLPRPHGDAGQRVRRDDRPRSRRGVEAVPRGARPRRAAVGRRPRRAHAGRAPEARGRGRLDLETSSASARRTGSTGSCTSACSVVPWASATTSSRTAWTRPRPRPRADWLKVFPS